MKVAQSVVTFRSGRIRFDPTAGLLYVNGSPAKVGGRAFDLLGALIERRGRLVPKQELMDAVWPGLVVEENNLQVHVTALRKLLGHDAIITVPGRGYRLALIADRQEGRRSPSEPPAQPPSHDGRGLPAPSQLLIGRESLIELICALVRDKQARLVTLTGPGGSGKTRLALHVTAALAHDFADGSFFVMLAPLRDPRYVASAIAAVLGLQEAGKEPSEDLVFSYLRDRQVLLTLDNFEHLLVAAPLLEKLLASCAGLKVLVTSRAALKLSGERDLVVPPLALPDAGATVEDANASPAVQLFAERARSISCDPGSSEEDIAIAAEICRRLDGLPLAIELAVARLRMLTPQALLKRLEHRLELLKDGSSNLPERQRTLRSAIGWSYELLEPSHRALFRCLSVFAGGWSLDAAEAVASDVGLSNSVLDSLAALVDQSLVQRVDDVSGEPRFAMLETVREFGFEELVARGELAQVEHRHAEYYTELAELIESNVTSAQRGPWLAQFRAEGNNFRAALTWLIDIKRNARDALRLAAALPWMWYFAGQFKEGREWLQHALELPGADVCVRERAKALSGAARLAMYAGDPSAAMRSAEESVELWRTSNDRRGLAFGLFHCGVATIMKHTYAPERGEPTLRESLTIFRALDDSWGIALVASYLGVASLLIPESRAEARQLLLEGRERFGALGDAWGVSTSSHYLASAALREGDYAAARELMGETLKASRDLNDNYRISRNLYQMAEIAIAENEYDEAMQHAKESLALMHEQGRTGDVVQLLQLIGRVEQDRANPLRAVRLFAAASRHREAERTLPPDDPALTERAINATRQSLGENRFEMEWTKGAAMSFEQAVRWILAA